MVQPWYIRPSKERVSPQRVLDRAANPKDPAAATGDTRLVIELRRRLLGPVLAEQGPDVRTSPTAPYTQVCHVSHPPRRLPWKSMDCQARALCTSVPAQSTRRVTGHSWQPFADGILPHLDVVTNAIVDEAQSVQSGLHKCLTSASTRASAGQCQYRFGGTNRPEI